MKRQKKEQILGRTNRRRSFFDSMIKLVVADLYNKFEVSILNGCGDIFDKKSRKKEKEREEQLELSENLTIPPLRRFQSIWLVSSAKNVERKKNTGKNK